MEATKQSILYTMLPHNVVNRLEEGRSIPSSPSFQQFSNSFGQTPRFASRPTPVQTAGPASATLPAERPSPPQTVFRNDALPPM